VTKPPAHAQTPTPDYPLREVLDRYLAAQPQGQPLDPAATAFFAQLATLPQELAGAIVQELHDQRTTLKLIASENYASLSTQLAMGNLLTDKYAEGFPGHRFYAGCDNVDTVESLAADAAKSLFGADYAFVQPHSGIDANLVAMTAILKQRVETPALDKLGLKNASAADVETWDQIRHELMNQRLLAMDYYSGGHLTHGYRMNVSSWMLQAHNYAVDPQTKRLDVDAIRAQLHEVRPLIFLVGYSAYPRAINFAQMRELAEEVGATFMVDMAHFAGLVAGKVFSGDFNPVAHAHVVTSTTHKTLRGPRGGIVLACSEYADVIDKACPTILGGPLPHVMAAKLVALREAATPEFADYAQRIVTNAQALAEGLQQHGVSVLTGGTDNHIVLADVFATYGLSGRQAETALRTVGITLNRNSLPFDENGPWFTSGLRLGSAALTTRGLGADDLREIGRIIASVLATVKPQGRKVAAHTPDGRELPGAKYEVGDQSVLDSAAAAVHDLLADYPLYPSIDLGCLQGTALAVE
jgi:glycine hydroxymethyltransferase